MSPEGKSADTAQEAGHHHHRAENPFAGQGMVVLDIGGDVGALVVVVPSSMDGAEIEICPAGLRGTVPDEGRDWWQGEWRHSHDHGNDGHTHSDESLEPRRRPAWPHVAVLPRAGFGGTSCAAVFPGLVEGDYDLWVRPDGPTALRVTIEGSKVSQTQWPVEEAG